MNSLPLLQSVISACGMVVLKLLLVAVSFLVISPVCIMNSVRTNVMMIIGAVVAQGCRHKCIMCQYLL